MSARRAIQRASRRTTFAVAVASNAVPTTTSLGNSSLNRFSGAQAAQTINGTGFVSGSTVYIDGVAAPLTTYVSSTQLTFTVPAATLRDFGTRSITVVSPAPGGGTSNAQVLTVAKRTFTEAEYRADMGRTMNGANVQALADQSAKADANRNLSQVTGAAQPPYVASNAAFNNDATLTLDSARHMLSGTWTSPPAQPTCYYLVCSSTVNSTYMVSGLAANPNRIAILRSAGGVWNFTAGSTTTTVSDPTSPHVFLLEVNGASSKYAKNAKTTTATGSPGTNTITGITLGALDGGIAKSTGAFAFLMVTNGAETTAERAEILDFLGAKYGIAIAA